MAGLRTTYKKKTQPPVKPAPLTAEMVTRQLSLAAGTGPFQHKDPIYHLTESFRQTFDLIGQARAQGREPNLSAMTELYAMRDETPGMKGSRDIPSFGGREEAPEGAGMTDGAKEALSRKTDMAPSYQPRSPQNLLMERFAEVAFQRGSLSAAVLRGQGKMMLFSCLNRAAGQERSKQARERMLFQGSSSHKHIPGRQGDIAVVNKGFADSAVGLVIDVLKDARQALDSFTALAEGKSGAAGMGTVEKQYPFLTDARERELLEEYQARLAQLKGPGHEEERAVLARAQEKAEAILQKKAQMKRDFLQKLRWLSHCAASAEAGFSQEGFRREAAKRLEPEEPEDMPPPGGGDDGADAPRKPPWDGPAETTNGGGGHERPGSLSK